MMKIGILQCDQVIDDLLPTFGDYPQMFMRLFHRIHFECQYSIFDATKTQLPNHQNGFDAFIITGSRFGVNDDEPWINKLSSFIQSMYDKEKKLIGICFGHQLIAKALGGKVERSHRGWGIGMSCNRIIAHKPWLTSETKTFNLLVSHQDQVVTLPRDCEVIGASDFCPYYMLQINHCLTVQGHPEYSKAYVKALMNRRQHWYTPACYQHGIDSLQLEDHGLLFANWAKSFLLL